MTKHKKRIGKHGSVWHQSAEEATLAQKPYYNGFACGHGVHGDTKYNRSKQKRTWERQMKQEGAHYKGSFDFVTHYRGYSILQPAIEGSSTLKRSVPFVVYRL